MQLGLWSEKERGKKKKKRKKMANEASRPRDTYGSLCFFRHVPFPSIIPTAKMSPKHLSFLSLIFTCLCFTKPLLIIEK